MNINGFESGNEQSENDAEESESADYDEVTVKPKKIFQFAHQI